MQPEPRLSVARGHYRRCLLCEHRCGVDRTAGPSGKCKAGANARVFRHRVEYGDEREIAPSHLFYLSGCDLRCAFCINELNAFDTRRGEELTPEFFRAAVAAQRHLAPRTLQWVGGEPTIHLPVVLEAMAGCPDLPRVVWKTDLHGTPEAFDLLDGVVDLYLADFKFGNDACAGRIAKVERYTEIVTRNLRQVARQGDLIVRHLLLPGPAVRERDRVLRPGGTRGRPGSHGISGAPPPAGPRTVLRIVRETAGPGPGRANRRQVGPRRRGLTRRAGPIGPARRVRRQVFLLGHGTPPERGYGT